MPPDDPHIGLGNGDAAQKWPAVGREESVLRRRGARYVVVSRRDEGCDDQLEAQGYAPSEGVSESAVRGLFRMQD
jgi:hypothetical protein